MLKVEKSKPYFVKYMIYVFFLHYKKTTHLKNKIYCSLIYIRMFKYIYCMDNITMKVVLW